MNPLFPRIVIISLIIIFSYSANAQDSKQNINRSPLYDYSEVILNNIDSIPDFESKQHKLKISGTIYKSDGVTPAKNVILYIEQADENGDFDLRKQHKKRYVYHRAWVKTDTDGRYTFYTFIPGNDRRYNQLQQLFPIIKEDTKSEYPLESFLFDDDDLLSKLCRKRLAKKGDVTRILKPKLVKDMFTVEKHIILHEPEDILK